jgi:Flp pilus assembly protein TadD
MILALVAAGCVATPRQPAERAGAWPPQVPAGSTTRAPAVETQPGAPRTDLQATATDRQRFQVHIDFGRVFEAQGNFDAAVLEYQDALTVLNERKRGPFRPDDQALAHRRMAGALDRLGRFAQAEVHYKTALKLSPKDAKIWNDAGYSYYLQGRWADAERALRTGWKLAPDDERIRVNLGLALAAAGKSDEAFSLLSQSSGDAIAHANLGYLLAATGQVDLARRQYETAIALRPDLELARRALAQLDHQHSGALADTHSRDTKRPAAPSTAAPLDEVVQPASTSSPKIPAPMPRRIPPGARSSLPVERHQASAGAPSSLDLSDLPPPPEL